MKIIFSTLLKAILSYLLEQMVTSYNNKMLT